MLTSGHKRLIVFAVPPGDSIARLGQEKPAARAGDRPGSHSFAAK